ncbi:MAG: hypothetical protein ACI9Y1_003085 [Lentisphaeria bacterium]|jgi:hypothetical protein
MMKADNSISLFEWCLYRACIDSIEEKKTSGTKGKIHHSHEQIKSLLASVAIAGDNQNPLEAYNSGHIHVQQLDNAFSKLARIAPLEKPQLLKALATVINHDGRVSNTKKELFRVIGESLDCTIPPLGAKHLN